MFKIFLMLFTLIVITSCTTAPQNREEFKAFKDLKKVDFPINTNSFSEAKKRLNEFGENCLSGAMSLTSGTGIQGGVNTDHTSKKTLRYSIEEKQGESNFFFRKSTVIPLPFTKNLTVVSTP